MDKPIADTDLIGAIYDAVIEPSRWDNTVDRIRRTLGFHIAMIGATLLPRGAAVVQASSNVPVEYLSSIARYSKEAAELWGGVQRFSRLPLEDPLLMSDFVDLPTREANAFYREWARPQGLVDQLVVVLANDPSMLATLGLGVHETMPPVSNEQLGAVQVLIPHLRRAMIISGLLQAQTRATVSFEAALSAVASGVLLVDQRMHIVYANAAANRLLAAGDPIAEVDGRLELKRPLVKGQLEAMVAAVDPRVGPLAGSGSGVPAHRHDGSGLIVHVLPMQHDRTRTIWPTVAAIFVGETNDAVNFPTEMVRALYGLRPAETRVFELIVAGQPNREIAETLGVAPTTVKTHMLRLFDKLGAHSREDVLRIGRRMSLRP